MENKKRKFDYRWDCKIPCGLNMVIESCTTCCSGSDLRVSIFAAKWLIISNPIGELGCFATRLK